MTLSEYRALAQISWRALAKRWGISAPMLLALASRTQPPCTRIMDAVARLTGGAVTRADWPEYHRPEFHTLSVSMPLPLPGHAVGAHERAVRKGWLWSGKAWVHSSTGVTAETLGELQAYLDAKPETLAEIGARLEGKS